MALPIIMHVNYCEQGQTIEEICAKAVDWGFDGVEFRRKRHGITEDPEKYLDEIAKAVDRSGLKMVIFGSPGPNLTMKDAMIRNAEVEEAVKFYRLAAERFKLSVCNAFAGNLMNPARTIKYADRDKHGSFTATEEQWDYAAEGFKTLGQLAEELGFRFAFETHACYIHDLPEAAKKLIERVDHPAVGVNFDFANVIYFDNHPSLKDSIELLGDKIYYVHFKNSFSSGGFRFPSGLGDGEINHREFLKLLKEAGYEGPICIEAPRPGDREWFAQEDITYLESLMIDLEWR